MFSLEILEGVVLGNGGGGGVNWMPSIGWAQGMAASRKEAGRRESRVRSCSCGECLGAQEGGEGVGPPHSPLPADMDSAATCRALM